MLGTRERLEALCCAVFGLDWAPHFSEWVELVGKYTRLLLIASRDHGKSTFLSNLFITDSVVKKPGLEVLLMSYSEAQVHKLMASVKDNFEKKAPLTSLKTSDEGSWSTSKLRLRNGSKIDSLTFGSSGRGGHYDLVIVDDPVKDYGGMDPDEQEDYFRRAVTPMVKPDGQLIVAGNYVYDNDLIERLEKNPAYYVAKYPAITNGKALWPQRWPIDKLEARRLEVTDYAFSREYLLQKVSIGSGFFDRKKIKFYDPAKLPERMAKVISVDPALSLNGDYTAIVVTGTAEDKKTYVLDYANLRTDDVQAMIDEIFRLQNLYSAPYIQIETIGFQKLLKHWLYDAMREKNQHFGIEEIRTHTKSKQARIMALQPRIEAGSLLFHPSAQTELIGQLCAFPKGLHDDLIDALCFQIGKWDAPGPMEQVAPYNSFEWWKEQATPKGNDWLSAMNL